MSTKSKGKIYAQMIKLIEISKFIKFKIIQQVTIHLYIGFKTQWNEQVVEVAFYNCISHLKASQNPFLTTQV